MKQSRRATPAELAQLEHLLILDEMEAQDFCANSIRLIREELVAPAKIAVYDAPRAFSPTYDCPVMTVTWHGSGNREVFVWDSGALQRVAEQR
jgi:hypothetical protein